MLKRLLILLAITLIAFSASANIVNNSGSAAADSISLPFIALDSAGNSGVNLVANDTLYLVVFFPNGAVAFRDTVAHNNAVIDTVKFSGDIYYNWNLAVADIDGAGKDGVYSWVIAVHDNTGAALVTTSTGQFQLYQTNDFNVYADFLTDSLQAVIDSLQSGGGVAKEASLFDPTSDSTITIGSSSAANADSAWAATTRALTDKANFTLEANEWELVWKLIDTLNVDSSLIGEWLVNNLAVAGALSASDIVAIIDTLFARDSSDVNAGGATSFGTLMMKPSYVQGAASGLTATEIADTLAARGLFDSLFAVLDTVQNQSIWVATAAALTNAIDSINAIIDSVQSQSVWGIANLDTLKHEHDDIMSLVESQRGVHTWAGKVFYVDPTNGNTHASGNRGGKDDPYSLVQDCHDNAITAYAHDVIILLAGETTKSDTLFEAVTLSKAYTFIRGPGRDFIWTRLGNGNTITITADGIELSGFQLNTAPTGVGNGIDLTDADFLRVHNVWINNTQGDGINILRGDNAQICCNVFTGTGVSGAGQGIDIVGTAGTSNNNIIERNIFRGPAGDAIQISGGTTNNTTIRFNMIEGSTSWGIDIQASSTDAVVYENTFANNSSGNITDAGTTTITVNNEQWATVDGVWDEVNTGLDHNVTNSTGKQLRETAAVGSTVIAFADSAGANYVWLASPASTVAGTYDPSMIYINDGTGAGQAANILQYDTDGRAWIDRNWKTIPDATSEIFIIPDAGREHVNEGAAQGGTDSSITLNALASSTDNIYVGQIAFVRSGPGEDQAGVVKSYNGTTKVAVVNGLGFPIIPTDSSVYVMLPTGMLDHALFASEIADTVLVDSASYQAKTVASVTDPVTILPVNSDGDTIARLKDSTSFQGEAGSLTVQSIVDGVWDELQSAHTTASTFGKYLDTEISGVSSPAGAGAFSVTWVLIDTSATPDTTVRSAPLYINNVAQSSTPLFQLTDNNGEASFNLDAGDWVVFTTEPGLSNNVDTFTVTGAGTDTLFVYSTVGSLTTVAFDLREATGGFLSGAKVRVSLESVNDSLLSDGNNFVYTPLVIEEEANSSGQALVSMYPNSIFTNDSTFWNVTIYNNRRSNRKQTFRVRVPVSDSVVYVQHLTTWNRDDD